MVVIGLTVVFACFLLSLRNADKYKLPYEGLLSNFLWSMAITMVVAFLCHNLLAWLGQVPRWTEKPLADMGSPAQTIAILAVGFGIAFICMDKLSKRMAIPKD